MRANDVQEDISGSGSVLQSNLDPSLSSHSQQKQSIQIHEDPFNILSDEHDVEDINTNNDAEHEPRDSGDNHMDETQNIEEKEIQISPQQNRQASNPSSSNENLQQPLRRSSRIKQKPIEFWDISQVRAANQQRHNIVADTNKRNGESYENSHMLFTDTISNGYNDPVTYEESMGRDDAKQWELAMQEEMTSIRKANTWTLVELPKGRKAIGCKWVYKLKRKSNGDINLYKGRLVAKGYTQKEGIDYIETFAPVARFSSIRALLALSAQENLHIHQMDVKCAYLS